MAGASLWTLPRGACLVKSSLVHAYRYGSQRGPGTPTLGLYHRSHRHVRQMCKIRHCFLHFSNCISHDKLKMHYAKPNTQEIVARREDASRTPGLASGTTAARGCPTHAEGRVLHCTAHRYELERRRMEARVCRRRLAGDVRDALMRSQQAGYRRPCGAHGLLECRVRVDHAAAAVLYGGARGGSGMSGPSAKGPG